VAVHFSIHDQLVGGYLIATVAIDRGRAQPHRRTGRKCHATDFGEVGGDSGRHRRRRLESHDLFDERPHLSWVFAQIFA
jgi:hypothetical protein